MIPLSPFTGLTVLVHGVIILIKVGYDFFMSVFGKTKSLAGKVDVALIASAQPMTVPISQTFQADNVKAAREAEPEIA